MDIVSENKEFSADRIRRFQLDGVLVSSIQYLIQFFLINFPGFRNQARRFIAFLLNRMSRMPAGPGPAHAMRPGRRVQPLPQIQVRFAFKKALHRFDNILRVGDDHDLAGLFQSFEAQTRGDDFGLLVCRIAQVFADDLSVFLEFEDSRSAGARRFAAVAQAAAVANDGDLFHENSFASFVFSASASARRCGLRNI